MFLQQNGNPKRETYCAEYKGVHGLYRCTTHNTYLILNTHVLWEPGAPVSLCVFSKDFAHDEGEERKNIQSHRSIAEPHYLLRVQLFFDFLPGYYRGTFFQISDKDPGLTMAPFQNDLKAFPKWRNV